MIMKNYLANFFPSYPRDLKKAQDIILEGLPPKINSKLRKVSGAKFPK